MLGMEELDEALEEVGTLLHLTLPSFKQVLKEGKARCMMKPQAGPWGQGCGPHRRLIFLAVADVW